MKLTKEQRKIKTMKKAKKRYFAKMKRQLKHNFDDPKEEIKIAHTFKAKNRKHSLTNLI